jgi:ERCC4-type nuclease
VGNGTSYNYIQSKLTKLFLEKGVFQILWTHSPAHTASLLLKLKQDSPEPVLNSALNPKSIQTLGRRNENAWALLSAIPFMTEDSINLLSQNYASLKEVAGAGELELCRILGDKCGYSLFGYLEEKYVNHRLN